MKHTYTGRLHHHALGETRYARHLSKIDYVLAAAASTAGDTGFPVTVREWDDRGQVTAEWTFERVYPITYVDHPLADDDLPCGERWPYRGKKIPAAECVSWIAYALDDEGRRLPEEQQEGDGS